MKNLLRRVFLLPVLLALAACSSQPGQLFRLPGLTAEPGAVTEPTSPRYIALQQVTAPAMQAVVEDRDQRDLLLFSHRVGDVEIWYGRDGVQVGMRDGMLVSTRGIGGDLMTADVRQSRALLRGGQGGTAKRFHSYLTGNDQIATRSYICDIERVQPFALTVGTRSLPTWYMKETCQGSDLVFENYYWVDRGNGEIRQSRQLANPFSGRIAFQQVLS